MRVLHALLSTLTLLPLAACSSSADCDEPEPFSVDEPVTAAEIDEVLATGSAGDDWGNVRCKAVCDELFIKTFTDEIPTISNCTLVMPENPDGTGEPGQVTCDGTHSLFCEGRRPLGHVEFVAPEDPKDALASALANMAYLEAASVIAFEQLAEQLQAWRASDELIDRCRSAAQDERAHARWLTTLAEQRGVAVPAPQLEPALGADAQASDMLTVATHNAVEGCVHESFAALMAAVRARSASSAVLRRVFGKIAADEARHGQLAWDIHAWLLTKLEPGQARAVAAMQQAALDNLPARARGLAGLARELGSLKGGDAERLALHFAGALVATPLAA